VSQRARVLHDLSTRQEQRIVVVSINALLQRIAAKEHWSTHFIKFKVGDQFLFETIFEELNNMGYEAQELEVSSPGQHTIRNNVFDIYPIGEKNAFRIKTNDGKINSIFTLNINTQRSDLGVEEFIAQPAREMPIHKEAISLFRKKYRQYFNKGIGDSVYEAVSKNILPLGIESLSPLFQESTATLFDYLPDGISTNVFLLGNILKSAETYWKQISSRYDDLQSDTQRRILTPDLIWLTESEFKEKLTKHAVVMTSESSMSLAPIDCKGLKTNIERKPSIDDTLQMLNPWLSDSKKVLFCLHSEARREQVEVICQLAGKESNRVENWSEFVLKNETSVSNIISNIDNGFYLSEQQILVVTEKEIFGQPIFAKNEYDTEHAANYQSIQDLQNLSINDPVVHVKYGVGRFNGLSMMSINKIEKEYVTINYANDATAYVKMEDLDLVSRYSGLSVDRAPLDEMNSEKWTKDLNEAISSIKKVAKSLIYLRSEKLKRIGIQFNKPDYTFYRFCNEFPFQETRDQKAAIEDIIKDMTSQQPMDRLVCGDVGFGKTEVAMRASFLAVNSGYQVAVMVPTTLLANQHYESFKKRFSSFGVNICCLTRLDKKAEKKTLEDLSNGTIDIVIGTHRLIQSDVKFKNIGLMVIDEEHRFGVNHKDKMRMLRNDVDVLSLTATPIPRTMSMAMHGIRDMSIIATPPAKRLSIRTFVKTEDLITTREAIQRELMRNGQVFYLHNRVESIYQKAQTIRDLIPGLRVAIAHGQMNEIELESVMRSFYQHEMDVLVCTTIIETGIDVPRANTILMDDADKLGLAQLHQLRGRVGRSHHQAYAYLYTNGQTTDNAAKRLEAMTKATSLGDGFVLANHDLEIRGAGEVLGEEQSGQIHKIGFALYMRLLERAIESINNGYEINDLSDIDDEMNIDIQISGLIDKKYIRNERARLSIYKRFASIRDFDGLTRLKNELEDSFGPLPETTANLLNTSLLRCYLRKIDVVKLNANKDGGMLMLRKKPSAKIDRLIDLTEEDPSMFQLTGPFSMKFNKNMPDKESRFTFLIWLMSKIISPNAKKPSVE